MTFEANFDGIVGTTHSHAGLSYGNVASMTHQARKSSPRQAALQGLDKMKQLADLGLTQAVLPPHERPYIPFLRNLGFTGNDIEVVTRAASESPQLYQQVCSAAAMWTANAATISPSSDTGDGRLHITPANLSHMFHRSLEGPTTTKLLRKIFADPNVFEVHDPLPMGEAFADEGAANHTRFCKTHGETGVEFFVFGRYFLQETKLKTGLFPARQTFEASEAIARRHQLDPDRVVFAQQDPTIIDAGVFHNDVISVGNENLFLYHEKAFVDTPRVIEELQQKVLKQCGTDLILLKITEDEVSVKDAVASYLFNSQLVTLPDGSMTLIAPEESQKNPGVRAKIDAIVADPSNPLQQVTYLNLRQSMRNGGGPGCLRLRVVLTEEEKKHVLPGVFLTDKLYKRLSSWVNKHYREELLPEDLRDPALLEESRCALDELTQILGLGSVYHFQSYEVELA